MMLAKSGIEGIVEDCEVAKNAIKSFLFRKGILNGYDFKVEYINGNTIVSAWSC